MHPKVQTIIKSISELPTFAHGANTCVILRCDCSELNLGAFGNLSGPVIKINFCILSSLNDTLEKQLQQWCTENCVDVLFDCPFGHIFNNVLNI